jgi:hypothetical protein
MTGISDVNSDPVPTYDFGNNGLGSTSFGQDQNGEMYLAKNDIIFKVIDPCHSQIPELLFNNDTLVVDAGVNYYWFLNDEEITGASSNILVPEENGNYYCIVENEFGCNIKSNTIQVLGLGLIENEKIKFKIYPNPFNSFIVIEGDTKSINSIILTDILGKIIWNQDYFTSNPVTLPDNLKPGIYILTIGSEQSAQYTSRIYKF